MGYLGRRIGKAQDQGDSNPAGADGAVGGGILDLFSNGYFERQGDIYNAPGIALAYAQPNGITATGGVISDYTEPGPGNVYRAHVFTASGSFDVSAIGDFPATVEYLVVAGGGGGGAKDCGGGGGAGGLRTNLSGHPLAGSAFPVSTSPGSYTVTVGGGGVGGKHPVASINGVNSVFGPITSHGGGRGGSNYSDGGGDGGSGGGAMIKLSYGNYNTTGQGNRDPVGNPAPTQGNPGGGSMHNPGVYGAAGGGGGAGGAGVVASNDGLQAGPGGPGVQVAIAGPTATTFTGVGAKNPSNNQYQYFAGGGGGAAVYSSNPNANGGAGGLGGGAKGDDADVHYRESGAFGTGGGGGGARSAGGPGGNGGSGIVVVRYQIGQIATDPKATGGSISFYNNHAIHAFTSSGTFTNTSGSDITGVTYVCIGGGGSGGGGANTPNGQNAGGGGGGAGGYVTASGQTISTTPFAVTIGAGGSRAGGFELAHQPGSSTTAALPGGTVTAGYGGGGGYANAGTSGDAPLGSGGGSSGEGSDPGISGPQGNNGGTSNNINAGGGGGAGGVGATASTSAGGNGGVGVQLPSVFQNPGQASTLGAPGPSSGGSGLFWVCGGGGGGHYRSPHDGGTGGGAPQGDIRYAGAGNANYGASSGYGPVDYNNAMANTGSGGGGISPHWPGGPQSSTDGTGGGGGSGLVLIAYPLS